jgi:hypothetical protein
MAKSPAAITEAAPEQEPNTVSNETVTEQEPNTVSTEAATELVSVVLNCVYSGFEGDPGPGAIVEVEADEAARLVSIRAAEYVEAEEAE